NAARLARQANTVSRVEVVYGCGAPIPAEQRDALRRRCGAVDLLFVEVDDTRGIAAAHNQLLRQSGSDLTLLLRQDVLVSPNLIGELIQALQGEAVGIAEPRHLPIQLPKTVDPTSGEAGWASHICMIFRTSLFGQLGGFDADVFPHAGFDVDFSWRARLAGHRIAHRGSAAVWWDARAAERGGLVMSERDRSTGAQALLALATKYGRSDLTRRVIARWRTSADSVSRTAAESFLAQRASGRLPRAIVSDKTFANFEDAALDPDGVLTRTAETNATPAEPKPAAPHAVAGPMAPLTTFLRQILDQTGSDTDINHSARAYLVDDAASSDETRPFLTVITRTQGRRIVSLQEVLLSLAGQTCGDFEVLLVCHRCDAPQVAGVEALVASFPESLRKKLTILRCETPGRAAPINLAFTHARGRYAVALDDDDLVFAHWVETFVSLGREASGALVRAVCVNQDHVMASPTDGTPYPQPRGRLYCPWPKSYSAVDHLVRNRTPFMSIAFPATTFRRMGMRLDETLETTEDWDFITRCALFLGVRSSPDATALYRWWVGGESTHHTVAAEVWEEADRRVREKLNAIPLLLPPGTVDALVEKDRLASRRPSDLDIRTDIATDSLRSAVRRALQIPGVTWLGQMMVRTARFVRRGHGTP
ncbi:MAG: glycosyltransferase, partial [Alphaproteobacteria bacterium]|nr:glycosyltransferase [Alphaproteobacteria bacterium]